jgi:hypothetical protein
MSQHPTPKFGMMKWGSEIIALQPQPIPVLYFDHAPTFSHMNGIIGVALTVSASVPAAGEGIDTCIAVAAFLKCNITAAKTLRDALNSALLLAEPVENPDGKAN